MKQFLILLAAMAALVGIFWLWPGLDLLVSAKFYQPEGRFYMAHDLLWQISYHSVKLVMGLTVLFLGLCGFYILFLKKNLLGVEKKHIIFLLAVLILGPGIIVHNVFKDNLDRARPSQIVEFGGEKQFTLPAVPSDQCEKNCSFPSGHAAGAFFLMSFAWVWPQRRKIIMGSSITYGLFEGLTRIVQGGHFLSDVLFSGLLVLGVIMACDRLILRRFAS